MPLYPIQTFGMGVSVFCFFCSIKQINSRIGSDIMEDKNISEENHYDNFKKIAEDTDLWNTFVYIKGKEDSSYGS